MGKVGKDKTLTQKNIAFGKWLKGKLASEDIRYEDLASELGMTRQTLSYHIREHRPFTYTQLVLIFRYVGAEQEEIAKLLT